jgi:hypothetical protein
MNEAEYLEQQAELAKAAIKKTLNELLADAGHVVDPRRWTEAHPWTMVGVAAITGLITTVTVLPDFRRKHASDHEGNGHSNGNGGQPHPQPHESDKPDPERKEHPGAKVKATFENLLKFVGVIRPLLSSLLAKGLQHARQADAAGAGGSADPNSVHPEPGDSHATPEHPVA